MNYKEFLESKIKISEMEGNHCDLEEINTILKPHQKAIVKWAVEGGKRAIFAAFGLGKSVMQIETLRLTIEKAGGKALVVAPLGVRQEFRRDGRMLGVEFKFIRTPSEMVDSCDFYITNYESVRDGKLDPDLFTAVSLDEASVLRSFGSKTYQTFLNLFEQVKYKFVATATPSPNKYKELIHYAGYLGVMDTGQALTRFFQRDSTQANNLTLYPHKEKEFWLWLNSWAVFLQKPSDLGFDNTGYDLPKMKVHYHEIKVDHNTAGIEGNGQHLMFRDSAISLKDASREKRDSIDDRVVKVKEIIDQSPNDSFLIWHDLEAERHAIKKAIPESIAVYGSQDLEEREQAIVDFSDGKFKYLSAKPVIAGSGCNFQRHCHKAIFMGIGYKFNDFIQAIHRIYRFLQTDEVEIHIIFAESEREILRTLENKWQQHNEMVKNMTDIISKHGLGNLSHADLLKRTIGTERLEVKSDLYHVANNDCVEETSNMDENSVDMIVTSIPFSNHYEYTPSYNDFGHTENNDQFWSQMDFLTPNLYKILKPGRIYACHVKDRILFGNATGTGLPTVSPFHMEAGFHGIKHGFDYIGMITVVTDVVRENNQTYRLGWSEQCKDGTKMGAGSPEYILLFHKPQTDRTRGYADIPVTKSKEEYTRAQWQVDAHAFWRSSGDRQLSADDLSKLEPDVLAKLFTKWSLENVYSYESHVKIGKELDTRGSLPSSFMTLAPGSHNEYVWHDVNRMLTLNGKQKSKNLQMHVCPLQFDIVDRLITRYSNPGELVFDPFGGLFTVPYRAIKLGRKGRASELNTGYFLDGLKYLEAAEREVSMPSLFDLIDVEQENNGLI